jgi:hypothetical protein
MSEENVSTIIQIGSESRNAETLNMAGADRKFRSAWAFSGDVVVLDPQKMKPKARELINAWRYRRRFEPILYNGKLFSADRDSVLNVSGAVQMAGIVAQAGQPFSVEWSTHDDEAVTLDGAAITGLGLAIGQRTDHVFVEARSKKDQIETATSEAEIRAILATIED